MNGQVGAVIHRVVKAVVVEHYMKQGIKPLRKIMVALALEKPKRKLIVTLEVVQVSFNANLYPTLKLAMVKRL